MTRGCLVVLTVVVAAACYSPPTSSSCQVQCAAGSEACPEGLHCLDGFCMREGDPGPCGHDAAPPDGLGTGAALRGLSAGFEHTCGRDADDRLWCWGENYVWQLGVAADVDEPAVAEAVEVVVGGVTGWREVSAGGEFTCAIADPDGEMYCWGHDTHGQLGRNSTDLPFGLPEPVDDSALTGTGWDSVVAGHQHTCGLRNDGELYCWGTNEQEQLGIGAAPNPDLPTRVGLASDWIAVAAEGANTCGIRSTGGTERHLYCWGLPPALGIDPPEGAPYGLSDRELEHPNHAVGRRFQTVAMGSGFACAIDDLSDLWCWGYDDLLQQGEPGGGYAPTLIDSLHDWTAIVADGSHACGLAGDQLYCWGASHFGQSGVRADQVERDQPFPGTWREVALSPWHTCAVDGAGEAFCWGDNGSAQLGSRDIGDGLVPRQVMPAMTWSKVVAGWHSTCAIAATDGSVWCWGLDEEGVLGASGDAVTPRQIVALGGGFTGLALHLEHGCAIHGGDGALWCWGDGDDGELGTGTDHTSDPTQVGIEGWRAVGVADRSTCGIQEDGTLWCWGSRTLGMLGDGSQTGIAESPQQITSTLDEWDDLSLGPTHACAFRQGPGSAVCWGWNMWNAVDESATVVIPNLDPIGSPAAGWSAISTGGEYYTHTCGLLGDAAFCWGSNLGGRLGVGDTDPRTMPAQLLDPAAIGWESISAGGPHTCALRNGGQLFCWGDSLVTPLGTGRIQGSDTPFQVGVAAGWKQVDAGIYHVCAIDAADGLWCWGDGSQLQLGSGLGISATPVPVTALP